MSRRNPPAPADTGTSPGPAAVEVLDHTRRDVQTISPPWKEDDMDRQAVYSLLDHRGKPRYYDVNGLRIYRAGEKPDPLMKPAAQPQAQKPQPPRAPKPANAPAKAMAAAAGAADGEINLTMWANRQIRYPFAKVRQAISERYSKIAQDEREAINFLIDEKLVEPSVLPLWRMSAADDEAA